MNQLFELSGDLRYIANLLDTIKQYNPEYKDLDEMAILKRIVFEETLRGDSKFYDVNKDSIYIDDDSQYTLQIGKSYVQFNKDNSIRLVKSTVPTFGIKIKQLPFNIHMAIDSGLLKLTKVKDGK